MTVSDLDTYLKERDRVLEDEDMEGFVRLCHPAMPPSLTEVVFHKARYESTRITPAKRHASGEWLRTHHYLRMTGQPLLSPDELPE